MRRFISWFTVLMLFALPLSAKELKVLTTVKPINMIVQELTQGVATSQALLPAGASPHDYALRPSDVKKIRAADLIIWVGPDLETYLTKLLEGKANSFALAEQSSIEFLHYEEEKDDGHDHHGHDHGSVDPHFWLGPKQALQAADVITLQLISHDPLHEQEYRTNLSRFRASVSDTIATLDQQLAPLSDHGYFVFHDGYRYFETQFGLNKLGHFTVDPDRRPGAKTLVTIRRALKDKQAFCVFSEPQFSPAVVKSVVSGTEVKVGTLDPMATEVAEGPGSYVKFLEGLGKSFTQCLQ